MADPVWFWQRIVSPHMAGLAAALAATGQPVTYVAERTMSADRAAQGWSPPDLGGAGLRLAPTDDAARRLAAEAPGGSIHFCQGFRANGIVESARLTLAERQLRQWVIMEAVDDQGWAGHVKRLEYRRLIWLWRSRVAGVLATGAKTPDWLVARGMASAKVFPFAYFLPDPTIAAILGPEPREFQFLFAGHLVERKRLDLLLAALGRLRGAAFTLNIVGAGPLEATLRAMADRVLPGRVRWLGVRPIAEIPTLMAKADCLVLPSRHDGWGAVVSEALMAGTPTICSDTVGAAGAVRASGRGGVFPAGDIDALAGLLKVAMSKGRQTPRGRAALAHWARGLGAQAGARYLDAILSHVARGGDRPPPPWLDTPTVLDTAGTP